DRPKASTELLAMIVLSRSKKAAVFTASLTGTPCSPPPRGAYAPLDIRLMDPYVRRTLPEVGELLRSPAASPLPRRARAETACRRRGKERAQRCSSLCGHPKAARERRCSPPRARSCWAGA